MPRKVTITLDDDSYRGLQEKVGEGKVSEFIENLLRSLVLTEDELEADYREMAADGERQRKASE